MARELGVNEATLYAWRSKYGGMEALYVWLPTTDGRCLVMPRYTEPDADVALLLHQLRLVLPQQPPPRLVMAPADVMPKLKM